ncbi:unnamed protein product [Lampetra fluviatilis]
MGSPLSPVVANVFMEKFETDAIQTATLRPTLWKRPRPLELLYRSCFQKRPAHNNNNKTCGGVHSRRVAVFTLYMWRGNPRIGKEIHATTGRERERHRTHKHQKIHQEWSVKSACESQSAAMSPSLIKQEPEENPSLDTFKGNEAKYEEVNVKCEDVMVKSKEVKVKCEDEDSTPKWDLRIHGGVVPQRRGRSAEPGSRPASTAALPPITSPT